MPKHANTVQFSLDSEYLEKLGNLSIGDESLGLTAKRLVLAVIEGEIEIKEPEGLEAIKEQVNNLTEEIKVIKDRLNLTHGMLTIHLDTHLAYPSSEEIEAIKEQVTSALDLFHARLADLEKKKSIADWEALRDRLEHLENHPQLPSEDEAPLRSTDGLLSSELAKKLGVGKSSVSRWKQAGRSPDGEWIFDKEIDRWAKK